MKTITKGLNNIWRAFITALLVVVVFTIPASKGILGKLFAVTALGKNQPMNNNANNHLNNQEKNDNDSANLPSRGSPGSNPAAGTFLPPDTCSTGRRHMESHGNHHRAHHRHYYLPNAR